jgi:hypothetical protein
MKFDKGKNVLAFVFHSPIMKSDNSIAAASLEVSRQRPHPTKTVGVFRPNQPSKAGPDHRVTRERARQMVLDGAALWINNARAIRLIRLQQLKVAESLRMGMKTIHGFAAGDRGAMECVAAWKRR